MKAIELEPFADATGFDFTWQDGSKEQGFTAENLGTYWLKIQNACGTSIDSITFARVDFEDYKVPNVITPNSLDTLNTKLIIHPALLGSQLSIYNRWGKQVYTTLNYQNDWDGRHLPEGVYFYWLLNPCIGERKGPLSIVR